MNTPELNKIEYFPLPTGLSSDLSDSNGEYEWGEILSTDWDKHIVEFEIDMKKSSSKKDEQEYKLAIKYITEINNKKKKILKENPHLQVLNSQLDLFDKYLIKSENLASVVAKYERFFYQELYTQNQNVNLNEPCKSIKL